jgi:hypothetical protein
MSPPDDYDETEETEETQANGEGEGAEGAAVFPQIPDELQINPLLLALLHAVVFIDGSTDEVIDPEAKDEAIDYIVTYLHRLKRPALERVKEDMDCLIDYAKQQGWPKQQLTFLKAFLAEYCTAPKG